jgi:hypothetical protein
VRLEKAVTYPFAVFVVGERDPVRDVARGDVPVSSVLASMLAHSLLKRSWVAP